MPHDPTAIRNVALVGHHGAGKTTLAEALLAATGAIPRRGSVEKGTTTCDFEPEEIARQLSISTALAPFTVNGVKVNLLDTPGYADFASEMLAALAAADLAVVVVSATDGVQAQTEDAWRAAAKMGLPRVIVINKLDRERADFDRTLAEIRAAFGAGVAPVELPIGAEADFHGVIDLLGDTATHYDTPAANTPVDGTVPPAGHEGPIPDELVDEEHTVHEQLVEGIVVGDDDLMERYLNGEAIDYAELEKSLAGGVASGTVFPVLCCSGLTGVGVDRLARLDRGALPDAELRPADHRAGGLDDHRDSLRRRRPTLLTVTKTFTDSHTGKMSLCKVVSGTLTPDTVLVNTRTREEERLHALQALSGHATTPTTSVVAGDFVAIPRLNGTRTGDTLAPKGQPVTIPRPDLPAPALQVAVKPATRADDDKLMSALQRLCDEDPALSREPRRRDAPDHPRRQRRGAPGGHPRAAGPQVQRPRRARGAADPLPRDDHRPGPGRGQAQEAVGWPRPVRHLPPQARAAAPGRGVRLPRRGGRRRHPTPVHPGGREGRDRDHGQRRGVRLPDRRHRRDRRRRQGPFGRLQRGELQDGGGGGHPPGHGRGRADPARADLED